MSHDQLAQPPSRLWEIAQLSFAHLVNDIYAPVLMALQPLLITTLGYSYVQAALLPVMHSLISSLLQPVVGSLADKRGFRVSVAVSILLSGCGIAVLGLLSNHYLAMLGWAAESGEEILGVDEIARQIEMGNLARSAAVFDFQKLRWMNGMYIRACELGKITDLFIPHLRDAGYDVSVLERSWLERVIDAVRGNCEVLSDVPRHAALFLDEIMEPDAEASAMLEEPDSKTVIAEAYRLITGELDETTYAAGLVGGIKKNTGMKGKKLFMPVRAMLTGSLHGPELDVTVPILGYGKCRRRIEYIHDRYAG